jgi:AcrR family transcriptional regulator
LPAQTTNAETPRTRLTAEARRALIEKAATEVFAERGYTGASMEEIARRSGISVPVLYDHFKSKQDLHKHLLERHFAELRQVWHEHLRGDDPPEQRIPRAFDAWFAYVQTHPYAWRMLFRDTTGDPEIEATHRAVADQSRALILPLFASEAGTEDFNGRGWQYELEMGWEVVRSVLQGLALWWYEHPQVPREQVVATAMNALWIGFERVLRGELWQPRARA